jgi:quercetin dioxygenase-like cupin family protein
VTRKGTLGLRRSTLKRVEAFRGFRVPVLLRPLTLPNLFQRRLNDVYRKRISIDVFTRSGDLNSERKAAVATTLIDNDRVIVTEWRFAPGAETGWHRHGYDYVVCPVTDGTLLLETAEGDFHATLCLGQPYYRNVGVEHNVINAGDKEMIFTEIELKTNSSHS